MSLIRVLVAATPLALLTVVPNSSWAQSTCNSANPCVDWQNTFSGGAQGLRGSSTHGSGVNGIGAIMGVSGWSDTSYGVAGDTTSGIGVIGHTSSGSAGVYGYSDASNGIGIRGYTGSNGTGVYGQAADSGTGNAIVGDANWSWGAWAGTFNGDINVRQVWSQDLIYSGTLTQDSDARLKQDVNDAPYGLKELLGLRPVTYKWIRDPQGPTQIGLVAQEVQKVLPDLVSTRKRSGMLGVNYVGLVPVTIRAIKQQQALIERQEARIAELERRSAPSHASMLPEGFGGWAALALLPIGLLLGRRRRAERAK